MKSGRTQAGKPGTTVLNFIKVLLILPIFIAGCSENRLEDVSDFPNGLEVKEASMWAKQVAAGTLPPLSERLPQNPLVAKTNFDGYERPGPYGGTWHRFHTHPDLGTWKMVAGYAPLIRWKFDASGLEPGLAESWKFNEDGSVLTLHCRKGVKWSYGIRTLQNRSLSIMNSALMNGTNTLCLSGAR